MRVRSGVPSACGFSVYVRQIGRELRGNERGDYAFVTDQSNAQGILPIAYLNEATVPKSTAPIRRFESFGEWLDSCGIPKTAYFLGSN